MSNIRQRKLPSGLLVWEVSFKDEGGERRARNFKTEPEAKMFFDHVRAIESKNPLRDLDGIEISEMVNEVMNIIEPELRSALGRVLHSFDLRGANNQPSGAARKGKVE